MDIVREIMVLAKSLVSSPPPAEPALNVIRFDPRKSTLYAEFPNGIYAIEGLTRAEGEHIITVGPKAISVDWVRKFNKPFRKVAGRLGFGRDFYIPKDITDSNGKKLDVKMIPPTQEADITFYTYEYTSVLGEKRYYLLSFWGRSNKPLINVYYKSDSSRQSKIDELTESARSHKERIQNRREERKQYRHNYKVDDVLVSSWGYEQTNIDFYQVVGVGEKSIKIRKIGKKQVSSRGQQDGVVPVRNNFIGPVFTSIPNPHGYVKVHKGGFGSASKWRDGGIAWETSFGYGH